MDPSFRNSGAVVKFRAESTAVFNPQYSALTGYEKIYPQPYGPFPMFSDGADEILGGSQACTCRSSYFDVDPYGRLFIPNGVTCQVYIADNAGNNIAVFGRYGNTDSRGGLPGPGELVPGTGIPLAWPTSVAASEDFVYVADLINARLVRVQMAYDADNLPGLTLHGTDVAVNQASVSRPLPRMASVPNPFNSVSALTVALDLKSAVSLSVHDIRGRLVRTLASGTLGAGVHGFVWDARDNSNRRVPAGLYIYRLSAGGKARSLKTILTE
jgi:hypothetical protein